MRFQARRLKSTPTSRKFFKLAVLSASICWEQWKFAKKNYIYFIYLSIKKENRLMHYCVMRSLTYFIVFTTFPFVAWFYTCCSHFPFLFQYDFYCSYITNKEIHRKFITVFHLQFSRNKFKGRLSRLLGD